MPDDLEIRKPRDVERAACEALVAAHFGSTRVTARGETVDTRTLESLVAIRRHTVLGVIHYRIDGARAEIWSIVAVPKRTGTGRELVDGARRILAVNGVEKIVAVSASDNQPAQAFWTACGFAQAGTDGDTSAFELATGRNTA